MRRFSDFLIMMAVGLVTVVALLGGVAGSARVVGPNALFASPEQLWMFTGIGGFLLGLSWRFIFWDLPGMLWHTLTAHRRNLQYIFILCGGIAILVFV